MKIGAIIQARMGSTRLSGKVMKTLKGKTILNHVIERVKQARCIQQIIIAIIQEEAIKGRVAFFRGSEDDVLSRYYHAAKENQLDIIVRITSDCPVIDPYIIDKIVACYLNGQYNIVTNAGTDLCNRTFPRGLDAEVFSFRELENAYIQAKQKYQREHVTPYIYESSKATYIYKNDIDYSRYRWTLDTEEDFKLIEEVYNHLYKGVHNFYLKEMIHLFAENPNLYYINAHVEQKKIQ
jgi:spore coat polysaccharide biosynthesis protein SpsF